MCNIKIFFYFCGMNNFFVFHLIFKSMDLRIDKLKLLLLLEARKDVKGNTYFIISFDCCKVKFYKLDSVLDFINSNIGNLDFIK